MPKIRISVICFTEQGRILAERIREVGSMTDSETEVFYKPAEGVAVWAGEQLEKKRAVVFIGACGIAVRAVAPYIRDKLTDSPVLVLDEKGRYVIPILSGHMGGANEMARLLAGRLGAEPVITTATDLNDVFAADLFAKENGLQIMNREGIAKVSSKALEGGRISISIEEECKKFLRHIPEELERIPYPPAEEVDILVSTKKEDSERAVLILKPKEYYIGIGCKKNKTKEEIGAYIHENLRKIGITVSDVAGIASIIRKKDEAGICEWAAENRVPFLTYSEEELSAVEGDFQSSNFVKQTVGVDNVCERSAWKASGEAGIMVLGKQAADGMTIAVAKR